jgi:hypothetical protein
MKLSHYLGSLACLLLICAIGLGVQAKPVPPVPAFDHPYYLHALSDLRAARWMLEHRPGNWTQTSDEVEAVNQIDKAIGEIKKASIDDGKNLEDHPPIDEHPDHPGRLHAAVDFLKKARQDISHDEDNQFAQGLQMRAYDHIDKALGAARRAIQANNW